MIKNIKYCLFIMLSAAMLSCGTEGGLAPLAPDAQLELDTLTRQITSSGRSPETRYESAKLLLNKRYPQAQSQADHILTDSSNPQAQQAMAAAIATQEGGASEKFVPALMDMLTGQDPTSRQAAARALASYTQPAVLNKLIDVAKSRQRDNNVRIAAISALQRMTEKAAVGALVDLLADREPVIRHAAGEGLASLTNIRGYGSSQWLWRRWWDRNRSKPQEQWLRELTNNLTRAKVAMERENAQLRERLVRLMNELYTSSEPAGRSTAILGMLNDPVGDIRLLGVQLAQKQSNTGEKLPDELRQRVRLMLSDPDPQVRRAVAALEASLADEQTAGLLLGRLREETRPDVRMSLLRALGQMKSPQALPLVLTSIDSEDPDEAMAAAEALSLMAAEKPLSPNDQKDAAKRLLSRLEKVDPSNNHVALREALLTAMGWSGSPSVIPALEKAMKDPTALIRLAGVVGLSHIASPETLPAILPLVYDSDRGVRQAAITAVAKMGAISDVPAMLPRTSQAESSQAVRDEAIRAILQIMREANAETLGSVVLKARSWTASPQTALLEKLLPLYIAALRAEKSDLLAGELLEFGQMLTAQGRSDEALPYLDEAYKLAGQATPVDPTAVQLTWRAYLTALMKSNDPKFADLLVVQKNPAMIQAGLDSLKEHVNQMIEKGQTREPLLLIDAVLKRVAKALTADQKAELLLLQQRTQKAQAEKDAKLIAGLVPKLVSPEAGVKQTAIDDIKALNHRAVGPLIDQLQAQLKSEKPDPALEAAILDLLRAMEPKLGPYDPKATVPEKLKAIQAWQVGQ